MTRWTPERWKLYEGREQTGLKHFVLENYLERVVHRIGYFRSQFVYVDGFSGPWRSEGEEFEDTSIRISIEELRRARSHLRGHGKDPQMKCVFVERDPRAFAALEQATRNITDIDIHTVHASFEEAIDSIARAVGGSFALTFIDPKGWTGFALEAIRPLLEHEGEVLVNFMFNHIRRFLSFDNDAHRDSMNRLFGGSAWREVEHGLLEVQDAVLARAKQRHRETKSGQAELFSDDEVSHAPESRMFDQAEARAASVLLSRLQSERTAPFQTALAWMQEVPLLHKRVLPARVRNREEIGARTLSPC